MFDWSGLIQIMFADIILSGDNALVIGMVAAGIAPEKRRMVLAVGMGLAAFFRIVFAAGASYIIDIPGNFNYWRLITSLGVLAFLS